MDIESGQGVSRSNELIDTRTARQDGKHRLGAEQDHTAGALAGQRRIADKLQSVPQTLFRVEQKGPPGKGRSVPARLREGRGRPTFAAQPPFVFGPTPTEVPVRKPGHGAVE